MATDDTCGREAIAGGGGQGVFSATDGLGWPRMKPAGVRRSREAAGEGVIAATDGHGWPRMKPAGVRRSREAAGDGGGGGGTGIFFNND
ncbi:MAG: hypothetical protein ACK5TG_11785 [Planctomyces sp.]